MRASFRRAQAGKDVFRASRPSAIHPGRHFFGECLSLGCRKISENVGGSDDDRYNRERKEHPEEKWVDIWKPEPTLLRA